MKERYYIARYTYSFYGTYTQEIEFKSCHRANSKANKADAMAALRRKYERGIWQNATIDETYLNTSTELYVMGY